MLSLYKKNDIVAVIGLIVIAFVSRLHFIIHPKLIQPLEGIYKGFFFSWHGLKNFYIQNPGMYQTLSTLVIIVMALYLNYIAETEKLFHRKTYVHGLSVILYSAFIPELTLFSMPFIAAFFLLIALGKSLGLTQSNSPRKQIFQIGLFAALACLFYFPSILFFMVFILIIMLLRSVVIEEIAAFVIGYLTPFYFVTILLYIQGTLKQTLQQLYPAIQLPFSLNNPAWTILIGIMSTSLLVYGWYTYNQQSGSLHISIRRKWNAIGLYFVFAVIAGFFSKSFPGLSWIFVLVPFSILLSQSLQSKNEKWNIFTFYFLLITLLLFQWVIKL